MSDEFSSTFINGIASSLGISIEKLEEAIVRELQDNDRSFVDLRFEVVPAFLRVSVAKEARTLLPDLPEFYESVMSEESKVVLENLIQNDHRINAIKMLREAYRVKFGEHSGLRATKEFCDEMYRKLYHRAK